MSDSEKLVASFSKHEAAAAKIIRTIAKKQLPKALKAYAKKVETGLTARFVDPNQLEIIPWIHPNPWCHVKNQWGRTETVAGFQFSMVFRVNIPSLFEWNKGRFEMIVAEDSVGDEGVRITTTSGLTPAEIKGGPDVFVAKFLDALRGWGGLRGEAAATPGRVTLATQIGSILKGVASRLGSTDSDRPEVDSAGRSVSVSFRTGLRSEDYGEYDEEWSEKGEKLYGIPGRKAMEPFKDKIKNFSLSYGEKGWWTFYVELK